MPYRDPRCVFVADGIGEADVVATWLSGYDIRAEVMNRNTRGGFEGLSLVSPNAVSSNGIEVWVLDPAQVPRAIELLAEQEMRRTARKAAQEVTGEPIDVVCEDCGTTTTFPPGQRGSVQDCPNCGAYLDVGEADDETGADEPLEEDGAADGQGDEDPPSEGIRRPLRRGADEEERPDAE